MLHQSSEEIFHPLCIICRMHPVNFHQTLTWEKFLPIFLLYLLIPDPDLEGGLEVELEQCFLGGLGCISISESLPSSESLELETTEDLDALLKYEQISIFMFCFSVLQFIYHSIWWCKCLVLFPSINRSHGQHSTHPFTFLQPLCQLLVPL